MKAFISWLLGGVTVFQTILAASAQPISMNSPLTPTSNEQPILKRMLTTGPVSPAYVADQECFVFANRIVSTQKFLGVGINSVSEKSVDLARLSSDGSLVIKNLIARIADAPLTEPVGATPGSASAYEAYFEQANGMVKKVILFNRTVDGKIQKSTAPESRALVQVLDSLCK